MNPARLHTRRRSTATQARTFVLDLYPRARAVAHEDGVGVVVWYVVVPGQGVGGQDGSGQGVEYLGNGGVTEGMAWRVAARWVAESDGGLSVR